jgi:hypothetical protein
MSIEPLAVAVVRWAARLLALALLLFWGWFFVAQLEEWVIPAVPHLPLLSAWTGPALYLLMVVGLVTGFRWELAGGLLVIGAGVPLFALNAPLFIPLAIMPGLLYAACWVGSRTSNGPPAMRDPDSGTPRLAPAA